MSKKTGNYIGSSGASSEQIDDDLKAARGASGLEIPNSQYEQLIKNVTSIQESENEFRRQVLDDIKSAKVEMKAEAGKMKAEAGKEIKNAKVEIEKIKSEIKSTQVKSVEILGIFVALFTLISLDFSFLKDSNNFEASVAFILIAGGLLLSFLLVMDMILSPNEDKLQKNWRTLFDKRSVIFIVIVALIGSGLWYLERALKNDVGKSPKEPGDPIKIEQHSNQKNNQRNYE